MVLVIDAITAYRASPETGANLRIPSPHLIPGICARQGRSSAGLALRTVLNITSAIDGGLRRDKMRALLRR